MIETLIFIKERMSLISGGARSDMKEGKNYIWHHIYAYTSEYIYIVFEINLKNYNSFVCILSNVWMQENLK